MRRDRTAEVRYHRAVTKRFVLFSFLLAWLMVSCASSEISILITARASGTGPTMISTVVVHVIPTQCWDPGAGCDAAMAAEAVINTSNEPVHRTIAEINADQPIRVAVHLHNPTPVMVHIVAVTASGSTTLYATRCYDPTGVVRDEVLLVPTDATSDADGDGWPNAMHFDSQCRDPDGNTTPTGVACHAGLCPAHIGADCNDMASATPVDCAMTGRTAGMCIFPGAAAICGDMIDQDCRWNGLMGSRDEPCGDMDMDGYQACNATQSPTSGTCDCNDMDPHIHPHATGACGVGIDWGCTGMVLFCDADMDGFASNVDCNDNDPFIHPGPITLEACDPTASAAMCTANHAPCHVNAMGGCGCDGVDNNCNGLIDEHPSCRSPDLDGDGHNACSAGVTDCASCDCNDCDSGIHPGAMDFCGDGIDEDGIGGDMACAAGDTDRDGYTGGQDCMEGNPRIHLDAPENCTTAASESCGTMSCPAPNDADMDGFQSSAHMGTDCNDMDAHVNAWANFVSITAPYATAMHADGAVMTFAHELCNGVDDDCNGINDEVLDPMNRTGCVTDPACTGGSSRCVVDFGNSIHHCGHCRNECNPGTTLVADACAAGACSCSANAAAGHPACAVGSTCCALDAMGHAVAHPGCFDTQTAPENCGACGITCDPNTADSCAGGHCVCGATGAACTAGQTCCGGACVDLTNDVNHCGSCTRACGANTTCSSGSCACDSATHGDCNGNIGMAGGDGCETDLSSNAQHCGSCSTSCTSQHVATGSCVSSACTIGTCATLYADCNTSPADGCEVDLRQLTSCGACGTSCMAMHANAQCIVSGSTASCGYGMCTAPYGDCDSMPANGCETSLRTLTTCGGCTTNCNSVPFQNTTGPVCTATGQCDYTSCNSMFSDCDGNRMNGCEAAWSPSQCGSACTSCTSMTLHTTGPICSATGACDYTMCAAGASDCDGVRTNGCELYAAAHCGPTCTACTSAMLHATGLSCTAGGTCDYTTCSATFLDCDTNRANGCEATQSTTLCGASCTNCMMNVANATGVSCGGGGNCNYTSCNTGFVDCDGNRANGCETPADVSHCGSTCADCTMTVQHASGVACSAGGMCTYTACNSGFADCSATPGCETTADASHCGMACVNCTTGFSNGSTSCSAGGMCNATCLSGFGNCDGIFNNGCETVTLGDAADCCGSRCNGGTPMCVATATGAYVCM
jgi:hypothetical protein